jgi:hypothetical protein
LLAHKKPSLDAYVSSYDIVTSMDEYMALSQEKKTSNDAELIKMGAPHPPLIYVDLVTANKNNLKFVHSLTSGVDGYLAKQAFKDSSVVLTNA